MTQTVGVNQQDKIFVVQHSDTGIWIYNLKHSLDSNFGKYNLTFNTVEL